MTTFTISKVQTASLANAMRANDTNELSVAKDQGAYLLVFSKESPKKNTVVYLKGCNPTKNEDWYDYCHNVFGGDDFGTDFELPEKFIAAMETHEMKLKVGEDGMMELHLV